VAAKTKRLDMQAILFFLVVCMAALMLPGWVLSPASGAIAYGIAALGICVLMRTGNITFGQSLPLCAGSYSAALFPQVFGINEFFLNCLVGGLAAAGIVGILGAFMKRYTGIFFAMLTLAFAMVLYGTLANITVLGGTDGFNAPAPSFLGYRPEQALRPALTFFCAGVVGVIVLVLVNRFYSSRMGWAARAVGANDIRISYLGANTGNIVWFSIMLSGFLAGVGGALVAAVTGHVTPELAYWTHSGELVLIAILGNSSQAIAIFAASALIEGLRLLTSTAFPHTWQGGLGLMLLIIVLLFPNGLDALWRNGFRSLKAAAGEKKAEGGK